MIALEIKDLSKSFGSFSLQNLTLTVPMGTALGLIGENGAGKSTTISLILGQLWRDSGEIRILGQDTDGDNVSVREDIGVVFDESCFPDGLNARQVDKVFHVVGVVDDLADTGKFLMGSCQGGVQLRDLGGGQRFQRGRKIIQLVHACG